MRRNPTETHRDPRHGAERDAAKPIDGRSEVDADEEEIQKPHDVRSFLTAQELQSRKPWKPGEDGQSDSTSHPRSSSHHRVGGDPGKAER
jgi:hypothetical protein